MRRSDRVIWCDRGWQPVCYGFCPGEVAWRREMRRLDISGAPYPVSDGRATELVHERLGRRIVLVTIGEAAGRRPAVEVLGLLVHEAAHVWQMIRAHIGERAPGDEMDAYALQAISQELIAAFHLTRGFRSWVRR